MSVITSAIRKVAVGFLYGGGFVLGVILVGVILIFVGATIFSPRPGTSFTFGPSISEEARSRADQFIVSDTSSVKSAYGTTHYLGSVENKGGDSRRYVNIVADLFDKSGKFIFQCSTQLHEGLRKNERVNFMIQCHDAPKELFEQVDSFKIYVRE